MATYGNPHTLPPAICVANSPTFTDSTLTANVIKPRKVHIDELRTAINNELSRRGLPTVNFTDTPLTENITKVRKTHIDELRTAINTIHIGDCSADALYCPQDALTSSTDFTDATITANVTQPRNLHITELRTKITTLMTSCICETEQCHYCADCGYAVRTCDNWDPCCNEHQPGDCPRNSWSWKYYCGSINTPSSTPQPYRAYTANNPTAWNGTVPWAMCTYTPPGIAWGTCDYGAYAKNHSAWNCKCNPYTWV